MLVVNCLSRWHASWCANVLDSICVSMLLTAQLVSLRAACVESVRAMRQDETGGSFIGRLLHSTKSRSLRWIRVEVAVSVGEVRSVL